VLVHYAQNCFGIPFPFRYAIQRSFVGLGSVLSEHINRPNISPGNVSSEEENLTKITAVIQERIQREPENWATDS